MKVESGRQAPVLKKSLRISKVQIKITKTGRLN